MRTLILILSGFALAALMLHFAPRSRVMLATALFALVWLGVCCWNLWTGLSHGFTLAQELPIHLVLFGLPVLAAWWLGRRLLRAKRAD